MSNPQTVSFEITTEYRHFARPLNQPTLVTTPFERLEDMLEFYHKERRRRSYADRATSASYRMVLTDHGRDMISSDDEHYSEKRYADAINGTMFML